MGLFYPTLSVIVSRTQSVSRLVQAAPLLALLAFITACGGGSDSIRDDFTLTVYSGRSSMVMFPIISDYAEATGADVLVKYRSTTELITTLQEEGDKSPADVFLAQDPGGLEAMGEMFTALPDSILRLIWLAQPGEVW